MLATKPVAAKATKPVAAKATKQPTTPKTPLSEILVASGFAYVRSETSGKNYVGHGYTHSDAHAVLVKHRIDRPDRNFEWVLKCADGSGVEGCTVEEFSKAWGQADRSSGPTPVESASTPVKVSAPHPGLWPQPVESAPTQPVESAPTQPVESAPTQPVESAPTQPVESAPTQPVESAPTQPVESAPTPQSTVRNGLLEAVRHLAVLSERTFRVDQFIGESNYTARVQLLKRLRQTDKVLVKDSGVTVLVSEFYKALGIDTAQLSAARAAHEFTRACKAFLRSAKPPRTKPRKVPSRSAEDERALSAATAARVAAVARAERLEREANPVAQPRPDAELIVVPDDVCLLEDPNNGIVLMRLEKPNSQGAICVYNNGSRVAAGVVPPNVLQMLRTISGADLVAAANQLLNPLTPNVVVTPTAQRHLVTLLNHYKEIHMATSAVVPAMPVTKFAPPTEALKKAVPAKAVPAKAVPAKAVPAKAVPAKAVPAKAVPAKAVPAKAVPAKAVPARAVPAKAVPAKAVPAKAVPAKAVPAKAVPAKAVPAKAVPAKAVPAKAVPAKGRATFRLLPETKATWAAFTGQKGEVVAAMQQLGAVAPKPGVPSSDVHAALSHIAPKNVSFYLSVWQNVGIVERV